MGGAEKAKAAARKQAKDAKKKAKKAAKNAKKKAKKAKKAAGKKAAAAKKAAAKKIAAGKVKAPKVKSVKPIAGKAGPKHVGASHADHLAKAAKAAAAHVISDAKSGKMSVGQLKSAEKSVNSKVKRAAKAVAGAEAKAHSGELYTQQEELFQEVLAQEDIEQDGWSDDDTLTQDGFDPRQLHDLKPDLKNAADEAAKAQKAIAHAANTKAGKKGSKGKGAKKV